MANFRIDALVGVAFVLLFGGNASAFDADTPFRDTPVLQRSNDHPAAMAGMVEALDKGGTGIESAGARRHAAVGQPLGLGLLGIALIALRGVYRRRSKRDRGTRGPA